MIADRVISAALVAGVFILYVATYASIPAADGYFYLDNITRVLAKMSAGKLVPQDLELLLNPTSALTQYGFFLLKWLTDELGFSIPTLTIIQTVNAVLAGIGAAVLYAIVRLLGGDRLLGVLGAALLAVSFGYWYFADGEMQLASLLVLLVIFWCIARARVRGVWGWPFVVGVALLNSVAALLRQENVLFGCAAVALLCFGRPWRQALRDGVLYTIVGSLGTWVAVLLLAKARLVESWTVHGAVNWYLWIFREHVGVTQDYQGFEYATKFDVPRVVKGQLTAFIVGTQAVVDTVRNPALLRLPKVVGLIALSLAAYGIMAILGAELWRFRRLVGTRLFAVAAACVVWIATYKVFVHAWLWPTVTKYQVVTIPPLILLLVLAVIVAQKSADGARPAWRIGLVATLVALVFLVDLWGGILPWRRYGEMRDGLASRRAAQFRPDDLFVSSESGIDRVFAHDGDRPNDHHVAVKNVFIQNPTPVAFATIHAAIERQLALGRRVFVYNFVPAPYSLIAINQSPTRGGTPLTARDFEAFLDELRKTYAMRSVFDYWEESKAPLYLFGERLEPFVEVSRRA